MNRNAGDVSGSANEFRLFLMNKAYADATKRRRQYCARGKAGPEGFGEARSPAVIGHC